MKKMELLYGDETHYMPFDWNGTLFKEILKTCTQLGMIPGAASAGEAEKVIAQYIRNQKKENTTTSRNSFSNWCEEDAAGPKNPYTVVLIDRMLPYVRFLHRPCTVSKKEILHELYCQLWKLHMYMPLIVEVDTVIGSYIEKIKKEYFNEETNDEDKYLCALLDLFFEEYHSILENNGVEDTFHVVFYEDCLYKMEKCDGEYMLFDEQTFWDTYSHIIMERETCLDDFGYNLRTLFLGDDKNENHDSLESGKNESTVSQ